MIYIYVASILENIKKLLTELYIRKKTPKKPQKKGTLTNDVFYHLLFLPLFDQEENNHKISNTCLIDIDPKL